MSYTRAHTFANDAKLSTTAFWTEARRLESALAELNGADLAARAVTPDLLAAGFTVGRLTARSTYFFFGRATVNYGLNDPTGKPKLGPKEKRRILTIPCVSGGIVQSIQVRVHSAREIIRNVGGTNTDCHTEDDYNGQQLNLYVHGAGGKSENLLLNAPLTFAGAYTDAANGDRDPAVKPFLPWKLHERALKDGGGNTVANLWLVQTVLTRATSPTITGGLVPPRAAITAELESTVDDEIAALYVELDVTMLYRMWSS